ncbi:MAG: Shikimate dehydrogenase [Planctomycetes bacterium ADurb.Bin126]|nr:MAG: Shikimate dehydrogenase [Planctomycetes bacterium ADurb.Bin126]HOD84516.1 shikimate dehydrogenase [Phycisphaerae bacterium]HQL75528.1 shikimate dehydrogenase [Phycisphaerae bacterium]
MDSRPTRLICALTSASLEDMRAGLAAAARDGADVAECRLDLLDRLPDREELEILLGDAPLETIATCRPVRQGGRYDGPEDRRLAVLADAADAGATWVDVESDVPPAQRPQARTILSHHDFAGCPADLDRIAADLEASPAEVNKIAFTAAGPEDALRALDVVRACRKPTIASAMGEPGFLSRVLARKVGAFGVFAALSRQSGSAAGQVSVQEIRQLYRWDAIGPRTQCFGVIGCPVGHSMSPAIHNAAFGAAGLDAVYVPLLIQPGAEAFDRFLDALLARPWLDWRGLSVTIPHKENALRYVGPARCDGLAAAIGAVNTVTFEPAGCGERSSLRGDNTDYAAAIDALCQTMSITRDDLAGRTVALLGAGGAARAILAALHRHGARTVVYNRTVERGRRLAREFGAQAVGLDELDRLQAQIIINCTPIGMHPNCDASPLESIPRTAGVVFDTIYNPIRTRLITQAEQAGCLTVSGLDMFVNQAVAQFVRWTARPAPRDTMRQVVLDRLGG